MSFDHETKKESNDGRRKLKQQTTYNIFMFGLVNRLRMREDYIQIGLQITGDKNLKKIKIKIKIRNIFRKHF